MKKYSIEFKWAIIYTVMTLTWALIGKLAGFHDDAIAHNLLFNTLIIIPSVIIYIAAMREKRKVYYQGSITYSQGLLSGVILTLFVAILGPLYPVFANLISPQLFANSIRYVTSQKMATEAEAIRQFNLPSFILQGLWAALIFGLVYSLIIALFLKKRGKKFEHSY